MIHKAGELVKKFKYLEEPLRQKKIVLEFARCRDCASELKFSHFSDEPGMSLFELCRCEACGTQSKVRRYLLS